MKARFLASLTIGVIVAVVLVAFDASQRHAALVASAAKSGGHQSIASILTAGFVGATVAVTVVAFVLFTVLGAPRRARQAAAARRERQATPVRRRRRAAAGR